MCNNLRPGGQSIHDKQEAEKSSREMEIKKERSTGVNNPVRKKIESPTLHHIARCQKMPYFLKRSRDDHQKNGNRPTVIDLSF